MIKNIDKIIQQARNNMRHILTESESKEILKSMSINVVDVTLATTQSEAIKISQKIGFPIVMKIASPDITHKSDIGGVKLNIKNASEVKKEYNNIMDSSKRHFPEAKIDGVFIEKMAQPGIEIIIGVSYDEQFGHVIMFGLGGILVEIIQDVSFRILPINIKDAEEMIREIKGYPLLKGYRGTQPSDIDFIRSTLVQISKLIECYPQIKELDMNPIFVYTSGGCVVDARIVLDSF